MKREWKPGDVALATNAPQPQVVFRAEVNGRDVWCDKFGPLGEDQTWPIPPAVRPLVVIDPEDREQVERLAKAWDDLEVGYFRPGPEGMTARAYRMQAALREFADPTPPKPEEPQGLGAVVEDSEGRFWIRLDGRVDPWSRCTPGDDWRVESFAYAEIDAVRVLSEGVQP